jgi:hypothetical protein
VPSLSADVLCIYRQMRQGALIVCGCLMYIPLVRSVPRIYSTSCILERGRWCRPDSRWLTSFCFRCCMHTMVDLEIQTWLFIADRNHVFSISSRWGDIIELQTALPTGCLHTSDLNPSILLLPAILEEWRNHLSIFICR